MLNGIKKGKILVCRFFFSFCMQGKCCTTELHPQFCRGSGDGEDCQDGVDLCREGLEEASGSPKGGCVCTLCRAHNLEAASSRDEGAVSWEREPCPRTAVSLCPGDRAVGCLPGWDAPWVAALLVSSQAGAVIARLHLWALSCPHPDLAAACRECAREAPPWNQAMSSKLSAEASWLFCCVGLEVTPYSSFCSFSWVLGTCGPGTVP